MQMTSALDLAHFPDSLYARELRGGFPELRFSAALEREFHAFHLERVQSRVRVFQMSICLLAIIAAAQLVAYDQPLASGGVRLICLCTTILACTFLVWAAWSPHYQRLYLPVARYAAPLFAVVAAIEVAHRVTGGHLDQFAILTTYGLAIFFLDGLLFREAVIANIAMGVALSLSLILLGHPAASVAYYAAFLGATGAVGALAYRGVERQLRTSFLERGLMQELAVRDGLTGLKNRGAFDDYFPRIWQQAMRDRKRMALLLIDVDHFKAFNDRYGHQAGDRALLRVAEVVQSFARRPLDMAARYGGEEFVLALFDLAPDAVRAVADDLRQAVQNLNIVHQDSVTSASVTASIGTSIVKPSHERSPEGAIQAADEALYSAKRAGRNRVVVMESEYDALSTGRFRRVPRSSRYAG